MSLPAARPRVVFVDVDDTLVRSFGGKRIPMTPVIAAVQELHAAGNTLYAWSRGGADYARSIAEEWGLTPCFIAYLPKPDVLLDDQPVSQWRHLIEVHPNQVRSLLGTHGS